MGGLQVVQVMVGQERCMEGLSERRFVALINEAAVFSGSFVLAGWWDGAPFSLAEGAV
jgi:hypothetical protein